MRLSELRRVIRDVVAETLEERDEDLNDDGENDFTDVMIARMIASGEPRGTAIEKGTAAARAAKKKAS